MVQSLIQRVVREGGGGGGGSAGTRTETVHQCSTSLISPMPWRSVPCQILSHGRAGGGHCPAIGRLFGYHTMAVAASIRRMWLGRALRSRLFTSAGRRGWPDWWQKYAPASCGCSFAYLSNACTEQVLSLVAPTVTLLLSPSCVVLENRIASLTTLSRMHTRSRANALRRSVDAY